MFKFKSKLGKKKIEEILQKEGVTANPTKVEEKKKALLAIKESIGTDGIRKMFAQEVWLAGIVAKIATKLSRGRKTLCSMEMETNQGSAQQFMDSFYHWSEANDNEKMLGACPEHYLILEPTKGRQEVIETTGGSPLASHFFINFGDYEGIKIPIREDYPINFGGRAFLTDGYEIGGALHQLKDTEHGFKLLLGIEFPVILPKFLVNGHHLHLACEFSNWIEFALKDIKKSN